MAAETAGSTQARTRSCPHCQAPNPLDLSRKCVACKKALPLYCFACFAPIASDGVPACEACGRLRWVIGDFAELRCDFETMPAVRSQRYMKTRVKAGRVVNEWRCMKCFGEETTTDAFAHFPHLR